jgi:hypothetical protein
MGGIGSMHSNPFFSTEGNLTVFQIISAILRHYLSRKPQNYKADPATQ